MNNLDKKCCEKCGGYSHFHDQEFCSYTNCPCHSQISTEKTVYACCWEAKNRGVDCAHSNISHEKETPTPTDECLIEMAWSGICDRGTLSCIVKHGKETLQAQKQELLRVIEEVGNDITLSKPRALEELKRTITGV